MSNYKEERPWGTFENLLDQSYCKVKQIVVQPGEKLSLQSHQHRDEHWIVVQGTATVTCLPRFENALVRQGGHVSIPRTQKHRLANDGKEPLVLIEVQVGNSFEESDIVRYEDIYNRN